MSKIFFRKNVLNVI